MDVSSRFADSTQYALRKLDTDRTDQGLTVKELKTVDTDGDNTISATEGACVGITSEKDLVRINEALQNAQGSASPCLELDLFGCEEETDHNLVLERDTFNNGAIRVAEGALLNKAIGSGAYLATLKAANPTPHLSEPPHHLSKKSAITAARAAALAASFAPIPYNLPIGPETSQSNKSR